MKNFLSIIILCRNEEQQIATSLKSAQFAQEIIVIDSGSTDQTIKIAEKYTDKIYQTTFTDFSALRNLAKEKAHGNWLFYIDADEEITNQLAKEILSVIKKNQAEAGYFVKRENYYLGKKWPTVDRMQRLFRKDKLLNWFGKVHETARVAGKFGELKNYLLHRTHNNLEEMLSNTLVWSEFEAQARWEQKHPPIVWWRIFRVMLSAFFQSYIKQKSYKMKTEGLIESIYQAFSIFITYAKLWELQQKQHEIS